jgi:hypothetical protein
VSQTDPSPIDAALDLLVYAPVGLALTLGEEVPKLAAKGRARLQAPLGTALVLGRFAAAQGRKEMDRRWAAGGPSPSAASSRVASPDDTSPDHGSPASPPPSSASVDVTVTPEVVREQAPIAPPGPAADNAPDAASLGIPGYDSLSASQVVQRLAGLSGLELEAVGAYEATHRGRRTILTRVTQLQAR